MLLETVSLESPEKFSHPESRRKFLINLMVTELFKTEVLFIQGLSGDRSNTRDSVSSGYPNTENRVENTTSSGVFLTKFEVFG